MRRLMIAIGVGLAIFLANSAFAQAQRTIVFGTLYFYPPFVFSNAEGPYSGFDVELARALATKLGMHPRFVALPIKQLFTDVRANDIEAVISAITITDARKQYFSFTIPYLNSSASYLIDSNDNLNVDLARSSNKVVGVVQGTFFDDYLQTLYGKDSPKVKNYDTEENLLDALASKKVNAALLDTAVAEFWLQNYKLNFKLAPVPISNQTVSGAGYGIVVNKNNTQLLNDLNKAILAMKADGSLQLLINKYFSMSSTYGSPGKSQ